jgi:hypothetical protein
MTESTRKNMSVTQKSANSSDALAPVRWGVLGASNFALNVSLPGLERDVAQAVVDAGTRPVRTPKPYAATSTS